jgi:hypothetical protein
MRTRPAVVLAWLVWLPVAHAGSFTVTNTDDAGPGSLRVAITSAAAGTNTIVISATGTINLASPLDTLSGNLTITGPGADQLTIRRNAGTFPILTINGTVQLAGVTIKDGQNVGGGNGGGIVVQAGSLVLGDSTVSGNSATIGSGIYSNGALTIRHCTISGNTGPAAIYASATTTVTDSTIADNQGTAIVFSSAGKTLTIDRSTISGNTDVVGIGGLELQGGTANISNTTFSGNTGLQGGDFWTFRDGVTLALTNVTAAGGKAPALLYDHTATVTLRNTLFAGTGIRCVAGGRPMSLGHNLSSDTTCNLTSATDKPGTDPMLGPLATNGGTTRTHALLAGSPALNAGDAVGLESLDQRGMPRVQFATVDIGAFETTEPTISMQPARQALAEGDTLMLTVAAMNQNSAAPLGFQWRKDGAPIAGATGATFTKPSAAIEDSGMYDVLVTNEGGSLPSAAVEVSVTPGGPDGDGGGCCSATGRGAWSNAVLGLALAALLGVPRRPRAKRRTR